MLFSLNIKKLGGHRTFDREIVKKYNTTVKADVINSTKMKLSYCVITQTALLNSRKELFFINFRLLTQDPKVPNAKTRVQSRVSGTLF